MLLDADQAVALLGKRFCSDCEREVEKVYCRDCDEMAESGHKPSCSYYELSVGHMQHRIQRAHDNREELVWGHYTPRFEG